MTQVYDLLDKIRAELQNNTIVQSVTFGELSEKDLDKTTKYPLAHLVIQNGTINSNNVVFSMVIVLADVVDYNKDGNDYGNFYSNDNLQDVLNSMFQVANQVVSKMIRGDLRSDMLQIDDSVSVTPFKDKLSDEVAGWEVSFQVTMRNDISIC